MKDYESIKETPSHILSDGSHVYLPPPSALEKASFFAQSVANYKLIHADESQQQQQSNDKKIEAENDDDDDEAANIHPLALASAKLQTNGISELSKAINLASLVQSNEYFAFTNIIEPSLASANNIQKSDAPAQTHDVNPNQTSASGENASAAFASPIDDNSNEPILRSRFILKCKRKQFISSTLTLRQHHKRLKVVTAAQKVLDKRYLQLRKRWKLSAPEHGSVVQAPVRSNETVAIDVDIYNQNHNHNTLGKITRMVPRYATIELADGFDVDDLLKVMDIDEGKGAEQSIDNNSTVKMHDANGIGQDGNSIDDEKTSMKATHANEISNSDSSTDEHKKETTEAKPFAVADPTLGSVDLERFDPDNVPMLTLFFQIEKTSTGFIHSVALSSVIQNDVEEESKDEKGKEKDEVQHIISAIIRDKVRPNNDEMVIQSLQHSLFCANVFDSIRKEVVKVNNHDGNGNSKSSRNGNAGGTAGGMAQQQQPVWLSSEMEENFLPPPSLMAGGNILQKGGGFDIAALSVIHCHEGEIKVQLNSEYALTVKLVDSKNSRETETVSTNASNDANSSHSGSQTKEELHVLCRLLLLHAQFVFHDHHKRSTKRSNDAKGEEDESKKVDYSVGILQNATNIRMKLLSRKKQMEESPSILQSCVALGSKVLFERQVRLVLGVSIVR
jgi:hypothetical protein